MDGADGRGSSYRERGGRGNGDRGRRRHGHRGDPGNLSGCRRYGVQPSARVFEFPVDATVEYADGTTEDHLVVVSEASTTVSWPVKGRVRKVSINRDRLTPLEQ